MNKLFINTKYGCVLFKIPFGILIIVSATMGIILGFQEGMSYNSWHVNYAATHSPEEVERASILIIKGAREDFWKTFIFYMSFFMVPLSAYYLSQDEDNQMNGMLLMHTTKKSLYLSRVIILLINSVIISLLGGGILIMMFYSINNMWISIFPEVLGIFLILSVFSLMGILVGTLFKRKHWAIVISIFMVLILYSISQVAHGIGDNYIESWETHHHLIINLGQYRAHYPLLWKTLIFISPQALIEMLNPMLGLQSWKYPSPDSISLLGLWGDIFLGVMWVILLISISYLIFRYHHRNVLEVKI